MGDRGQFGTLEIVGEHSAATAALVDITMNRRAIRFQKRIALTPPFSSMRTASPEKPAMKGINHISTDRTRPDTSMKPLIDDPAVGVGVKSRRDPTSPLHTDERSPDAVKPNNRWPTERRPSAAQEQDCPAERLLSTGTKAPVFKLRTSSMISLHARLSGFDNQRFASLADPLSRPSKFLYPLQENRAPIANDAPRPYVTIYSRPRPLGRTMICNDQDRQDDQRIPISCATAFEVFHTKSTSS